MKKWLFWLVLLLVYLPVSGFGLELLSIYPKTAFEGSAVTIIGGPFSEQTLVALGDQQLHPRLVGTRQLVFIVPTLPVGEYALFIIEGAQTSRATFSLLIELPPPVINSISPTNIDVCSTPDQRRITLRGEHIQDSARLLLNDMVVPVTREDDLSYSFTPPPLQAGSYGLQLINPDGKKSLPHTLWVNNVPAIESVSRGDNFVNYYQMIIQGKNFFHNSVLLISEYPGGFADLPPRQRFIPAQGGPAVRGRSARPGDAVRYQDCNTLIYDRYPPTGQPLRMILRVGNPDGKQTSAYEITLP